MKAKPTGAPALIGIVYRPLPDHLARNLRLLFVGINPGLRSAAAGHYYANPRNPFWRLLFEAGLTPIQLRPEDDSRILEFGYGLTDAVKRPSRGASDLRPRDFTGNRDRLAGIVRRYRPRAVCFNSKTAFEGFFGKRVFGGFGPQSVTLAGAPVFVLPSTSPANAAVPLATKTGYFKALKLWLETLGETPSKIRERGKETSSRVTAAGRVAGDRPGYREPRNAK